jgi:protease-4
MKRRIVVLSVIGLVVLSLVLVFTMDFSGGQLSRARNTIGIIYVQGPLLGGASSSGLFGYVEGSDTVTSYLQEARNDQAVKAVVVRIDSPGGSAGAAQEVAREIEKLRDSGKIVVASLGDTATSGAYWVAAATECVVANPGTVTGSIGVVMHFMDYVDLYDKIGVTPDTIKAGEHKDMGDPARPLTGEERVLLQAMVDDIHRQFIEHVAERRGMPVENVEGLADGRVFTGNQAHEAGLVDEMGNFEDAIDVAASRAEIRGPYEIREYGRLTPLEQLLEALSLRSPVHQGLLQSLEAYRSLLRLPGY